MAEKYPDLQETVKEQDSADSLLKQFSASYAKYGQLSPTKELRAFDNCIENLLAKLDEYNSLIDMIRGDSNLCLSRTLDEINTKQRDLEMLFQKVDHLESLVAIFKTQVSSIEQLVVNAENRSLPGNHVKKLLFSIPDLLIKTSTGAEPVDTSRIECSEMKPGDTVVEEPEKYAQNDTELKPL